MIRPRSPHFSAERSKARASGVGAAENSNPAAEFALDHVENQLDMRLVFIEARNIGEVFAARLHEGVANFAIDFLQCLETIGGKTWRDYGNVPFSRAREFGDMLDRIGLQPFFWPEPWTGNVVTIRSLSHSRRSASRREVFRQ